MVSENTDRSHAEASDVVRELSFMLFQSSTVDASTMFGLELVICPSCSKTHIYDSVDLNCCLMF